MRGGYLIKSEGQTKNCFHNTEPYFLKATFTGTCIIQYIHKWSRYSRMVKKFWIILST